MGKVKGTVEVASRRDGADQVVKFPGLQVVLFADLSGSEWLSYTVTKEDGSFEFAEMDTGTKCALIFPAVAVYKDKPARIQTPSQVAFELKAVEAPRNARYASGAVPDVPDPGSDVEKLQAEIRGYIEIDLPAIDARLVTQSERPGTVIRRISQRLAANANARAELQQRLDQVEQPGADLAAIGASARATFLAALKNSNDLLDSDLKYTVPAARRPATLANAN